MEKVKINDESYEIRNIAHNGNLLTLEFDKETDISHLNLSVIELCTNGGLKCAEFTGYTTIYKSNGNEVILSNDGSIYTEPVEPIKPYVPTPEEAAILEAKSEISALKRQIEETDYKIIKCSEYQLTGLEMPYAIAPLHAERQVMRDRINTLELKIGS